MLPRTAAQSCLVPRMVLGTGFHGFPFPVSRMPPPVPEEADGRPREEGGRGAGRDTLSPKPK